MFKVVVVSSQSEAKKLEEALNAGYRIAQTDSGDTVYGSVFILVEDK